MASVPQTLRTRFPAWLEIIESDDGQYRIMDSSFDDGAMELACFNGADWAMRFAMRLAEVRGGALQQR